MDPVSVSSFRSEMEKIAYARAAFNTVQKAAPGFMGGARAVANKGKEFVRKGWDDIGEGGARGGWMGAAKNAKGETKWHHQVRSRLPIGGKSMTVGFTALAAPSVLKKEDPMGRGRSRLQRATGLAAGTLGGLAGVGAVMRGKVRPGFMKSMAGGIGGAVGAEYLASKPFNKARKERMQGGPLSREQRAQYLGRSLPQQGRR